MRKGHRSQQTGRQRVGRARVQELDALYRTYVDLIYYYVDKSVRHREDAEDLTAEIFLKAVQDVGQRSPGEMKQWLFQVTRTTIADFWREHSRASLCSLEALQDAGWDPATAVPAPVDKKLADCLQRLLDVLPQRYREVLVARFLLGLPIKDTALSMRVTIANVKVLQLRALKRAAELTSIAQAPSHTITPL
jgi:RNA polymerase sigma-70 factor, ECF subfamily